MKKQFFVILVLMLMISGCLSVTDGTDKNVETEGSTETLLFVATERTTETVTVDTESAVTLEIVTVDTESVMTSEIVIVDTELVMETEAKVEVVRKTDTEEEIGFISTEDLESNKVDKSEVVNDSQATWTEEEIEDFWEQYENVDGSFETITDGYGLGVEIEISPVP